MRKLLKIVVFVLLIASMLYFVVPVAAVSDRDNFPRLDDHYWVTCPNEDAIMSKARAGEIDNAVDLRVAANIEELRDDYDWSISTNMGYGFHYIGLNCRDVCPDTAGSIQDIGRNPNDPLFPMNISTLRFAMHLIVGGEIMDTIVSETFGWTQTRIDTIPSPAGAPFYNEELTFPHDEATALSLLNQIGFTNASGYWVNTNASIGPVGELRPTSNPIGILGCPEATLSTSMVSKKCADEWKRFFGKMSDGTTDLFYYYEYPWTTMADMVFIQRDMDMAGLGWSVGRNPDYLYVFFHSDFIGYDDYNWPGYSDPETDELLFALYNWRWPNGTYILTTEKLIEVAFAAQERLYYHQPYLIDYCEVTPVAYAPGVANWIESLGYGSDNGWTYDWTYWEESPDHMYFCNPGPPGNFNPIGSSTVYEWNVLARVFDGLMEVEPFYHNDVYWAITEEPGIEPYSDEEIDYGQEVNFKLRHGITWHDGSDFTADDALFALDLICNLTLPRFSTVYTTFVSSEKINDYEFNVTMDGTGMYIVYDYAGCMMLFNEKIYMPFWNDYTAADAWEPWGVDYDDWMWDNYAEVTDTGDLTCLVGTGRCVFVEWDEEAGVVALKANRPFSTTWNYEGNYFAGKGFAGARSGFVREDVNFDGIVEGRDLYTVAKAYGAEPGDERWRYGQCDVVWDLITEGRDLFFTAKKYGWKTLPD